MLAPKHPNPRFSLGLNAVARGELREAAQHYSQAAGLDTRRSEHLYYLAQLELELGEEAAARQHLRDAATIARSGALHLNHLIWLALIDDDRPRIRVLAQDLATLGTDDATTLADAAFFLGLGDQPAEAVRFYEQVLGMKNGRGTMFPLTALRWGSEYHALHYATYLRSSDRADRADRVLLDLEQFLDHLERNGFRHWGLTYVRAGIAAQRGDEEIALQLLEQARALGLAPPLVVAPGSCARSTARSSGVCADARASAPGLRRVPGQLSQHQRWLQVRSGNAAGQRNDRRERQRLVLDDRETVGQGSRLRCPPPPVQPA